MTLERIEFGPEGLAWVRKCLSCGNTLSNLLLDLPLETGRVYTYLPNGLDPASRTMFETGGIRPMMGSDLDRDWTVHEIRNYNSASEDRVCIFEDIAKVGGPCLDTSNGASFSHGKEIYDFLTSRDQDPHRIRCAMYARQYPSIGVLTKIPNGATIRHRQEVSRHFLEAFATKASQILVGAYDEESYLVWSAVRPGKGT